MSIIQKWFELLILKFELRRDRIHRKLDEQIVQVEDERDRIQDYTQLINPLSGEEIDKIITDLDDESTEFRTRKEEEEIRKQREKELREAVFFALPSFTKLSPSKKSTKMLLSESNTLIPIPEDHDKNQAFKYDSTVFFSLPMHNMDLVHEFGGNVTNGDKLANDFAIIAVGFIVGKQTYIIDGLNIKAGFGIDFAADITSHYSLHNDTLTGKMNHATGQVSVKSILDNVSFVAFNGKIVREEVKSIHPHLVSTDSQVVTLMNRMDELLDDKKKTMATCRVRAYQIAVREMGHVDSNTKYMLLKHDIVEVQREMNEHGYSYCPAYEGWIDRYYLTETNY